MSRSLVPWPAYVTVVLRVSAALWLSSHGNKNVADLLNAGVPLAQILCAAAGCLLQEGGIRETEVDRMRAGAHHQRVSGTERNSSATQFQQDQCLFWIMNSHACLFIGRFKCCCLMRSAGTAVWLRSLAAAERYCGLAKCCTTSFSHGTPSTRHTVVRCRGISIASVSQRMRLGSS